MLKSLVCACCLPVIALKSAAQAYRLADSSPARIVASAHQPGEIGAVLRQRQGAVSATKLKAIGDSLVSQVLRAAAEGRPADNLVALMQAGYPESVAPGVPLGTAVDLLIRIHREAPPTAAGVKAAALQMMASVVGFNRAQDYLRRVATSDDQTASVAMGVLRLMADSVNTRVSATATERGTVRQFLELLWRRTEAETPLPGMGGFRGRPSVPDGRAYYELSQYARARGWIRD